MESYGEWKVTIYDVIFGELRFLEKPNLRELTVHSNSQNYYVAKVWRVSR